MRFGVTLAAALGATALLAASAGASTTDNPVLTGDVGQDDSFTITVKDASGAVVKHLDPGAYTLVVHDHSAFHNFDLSGPGVAVTTDVEKTGDTTFAVTLTDGTYFFQCDPHSDRMRGSFTVGTVAAPPTVTTPTATAPTKAIASIAGASSTFRPASGLSAGAFSIVVDDRSATDGFRLSGPGVSRSTGARFRGKVTWKVKLAAGRYSYGSALNPKRRHTFTVSS